MPGLMVGESSKDKKDEVGQTFLRIRSISNMIPRRLTAGVDEQYTSRTTEPVTAYTNKSTCGELLHFAQHLISWHLHPCIAFHVSPGLKRHCAEFSFPFSTHGGNILQNKSTP